MHVFTLGLRNRERTDISSRYTWHRIDIVVVATVSIPYGTVRQPPKNILVFELISVGYRWDPANTTDFLKSSYENVKYHTNEDLLSGHVDPFKHLVPVRFLAFASTRCWQSKPRNSLRAVVTQVWAVVEHISYRKCQSRRNCVSLGGSTLIVHYLKPLVITSGFRAQSRTMVVCQGKFQRTIAAWRNVRNV